MLKKISIVLLIAAFLFTAPQGFAFANGNDDFIGGFVGDGDLEAFDEANNLFHVSTSDELPAGVEEVTDVEIITYVKPLTFLEAVNTETVSPYATLNSTLAAGASFPKNPPSKRNNLNISVSQVGDPKLLYITATGEYLVRVKEWGQSEYREFLMDWYLLDLSESIDTHRPRNIYTTAYSVESWGGTVFVPEGKYYTWRTGIFRNTGIKRFAVEYMTWWGSTSVPFGFGTMFNDL